MSSILERIHGIEQAATQPSAAVGGFLRQGVLVAFDHATYTAAVQIGSEMYTGLACLQNIREDLLTPGCTVLVMLSVIGLSDGAVLIGTVGGRPPRDPLMDVIEGHGHRIGVPGDGKPIRQEDIVS